ncbi:MULTISPECIES: hypothetical protein [Glycomyces]|uniref:Uncharacterized protein n=2 Tax=Glycomyces TaxID=58113 RepID=A0A9X3PIR6_9ACTN|nr:hypothetical protein [Glycomyces lechevalierae]MDA1384393.1 hypothetical protein [Glycomyces lechevalierae]MDR7339173.1 hypothetical protein [Glycomyces lechevalierae]
MPGDAHELIVQVLQDEPLTAAWLMDLADHDRRFAACTGAETRSTSVGSMGRTERRADFMAILKFPNEEDRIVIVEVQTEWKDEKHFRLPGYMTRAFEDHRLPTELVLVCPDDRVALKYRKGIKLGPDNTIQVHAVGRSDFPGAGAEHLPTAAAAVITAVYGKDSEGPRAELFISTLDRRLGTIEPGRAADYIKHLLTILEDEPARMLEELMRTQTRPYHSEYSDSLRAEGVEQGKLEEARQVLVELLEATQSGITAEQRQRIEASTDRQELIAWRSKFIASGSSVGLFDE